MAPEVVGRQMASGSRDPLNEVLGQIQGVSKEIAAMLDDASIELSKVMRKRTEQAELKAYLDGLLFSVGDQPKAKGVTP